MIRLRWFNPITWIVAIHGAFQGVWLVVGIARCGDCDYIGEINNCRGTLCTRHEVKSVRLLGKSHTETMFCTDQT